MSVIVVIVGAVIAVFGKIDSAHLFTPETLVGLAIICAGCISLDIRDAIERRPR